MSGISIFVLMNAIQSVQKTIEDYALFKPSSRLLLGASGGADSTALAFILKSLEYEVALVHVNFQLRGAESDADAVFVKELAQKLSVPIHIKTCDTASMALQSKRSIQEMARAIRYEFFEEVREREQYDFIITAHHAGDNLETILYTILKGAHVSGLRGIPLKRGNIVRPLLYTSKKSIDQYILDGGISFRLDTSNQSNKYKRNFLRNQIIPELLKINPNLEHTIAETSKIGKELELWLEASLDKDRKELAEKRRLSLLDKQESPHRKLWLYQLLKPYQFKWDQVCDLWNAWGAEHRTGKYISNAKYKIYIDRSDIVLINNEDSTGSSEKCFYLSSIDRAAQESNGLLTMADGNSIVRNEAFVASLDRDVLKFPLTLRQWKEGDHFAPIGMNGQEKKLNDFLRDEKVPTHLKKDVWVLLSGKDIAWVIGYRISEQFKVTSETSSIIEVTFNKDLLPIINSTGDPT